MYTILYNIRYILTIIYSLLINKFWLISFISRLSILLSLKKEIFQKFKFEYYVKSFIYKVLNVYF